MGIFDWLFRGEKAINKDIARKESQRKDWPAKNNYYKIPQKIKEDEGDEVNDPALQSDTTDVKGSLEEFKINLLKNADPADYPEESINTLIENLQSAFSFQPEEPDSLKQEGNWTEDNKLKVWEKDLHITPPNEMSLIVDTKLQNIELWNYFLDNKPFNGIVYLLRDPNLLLLPPEEERLIEFQYEIKNGIKDGYQTIFYETNPFTIQYKIMMKNDMKNGEEIGYFKNGKIQYSLSWLNNKRDGKEISYYKNGKISYEVFHKNGKKNGTDKEFYENGSLKKIMEFKNGDKDGEFKQFFEDSKVHITGYFKNNTESGLWKVFDEEGNLVSEKTFN
jgi:antitoxin component YwqK of YwqJK toxin-antitoxin module